jgi:hypothetical protein
VENDFEDQLAQARKLLAGFTSYDEHGVPRHHYFQKDSPEEAQARMALVALIRGRRITYEIMDKLAALVDPRPQLNPNGTLHSDSYLIAERRICFELRRRGRSRDHGANSHIYSYMEKLVKSGVAVGEAQINAAEKFGLGEDQVRSIWKRFKRLWAKITAEG